MKIRKNAKISPLEYAVSSLKAGIIFKPRECLLNQSPWDVVNFSPPPSPPLSQVNGSGVVTPENGCGFALERELNLDAMQEVEEDHPPLTIVMCCKTDEKTLQHEASQGHPPYDHHLSLVKSHNNNSEKSVPAGEARVLRHPRLRKAPARYSFEEEDVGKKRVRKNIKVKSLKTLV